MESDYRYDLAVSYLRNGQINAAIEKTKSLLSEDPNIAGYHGLLASCLLSQGRVVAAEYELGVALSLNPNECFYIYLQAKIELFKNNFHKCIELCDESLGMDSIQVDSHLLKSHVLSLLDKAPLALNSIRDAASVDPESILVMIAFGEYFQKNGEWFEAVQYASFALEMDAGNESANILMGELRLAEGDIAEAEYHAKFAISQNPNSEMALKLFCDIKMKNSFFMGLWWKFNSRISSMGNVKGSVILISMYLVFQFLSLILGDLGYTSGASLVSSGWLVFVIYSWIGIPIYHRKLKQELRQFRFNSEY